MLAESYGMIPGSLKEIFSIKDHAKWQGRPITVQINNIKIINENNPADKKYRCVFSDGKYTAHSVFGTDSNAYLESNGFSRYSIITVKAYSLVKTQKRIILADAAEVKVPKTERVGGDFIAIDSYFEQNPDDDLYRNGAPQEPQVKAPSTPAPQAPPSHVGDRPISSISDLTPFQNLWTIRGRLSYKGDIKTWSNARGEGKLFNVNFMDNSEEIRATAFNEIADKFYNMLEEGKVYYVTNARINPAKPQFSHLKHAYELSLDKRTEITECFDSAGLPQIKFDFTKLENIKELEAGSVVDVIGVLRSVEPVSEITAKSTGRPFKKRNVSIVDDSDHSIDVTLWSNTAVDFLVPQGSVIAFKGAKVNEFGGKSLSLSHGSTFMANPETPEAYRLKGWYDHQGANTNFKSFKNEVSRPNSISDRKTIGQAQDENLGTNEKPDFFNIKATINFVRSENIAYPACNNEVNGNSCNRKVLEVGDGWRCERCDLTYAQPHYRYILSCSVSDHTGQIWITLFDQDAQKILNKSADELVKLKDADNGMEGSNAEYINALNAVVMKEFNFRLKARQETYNDNVRVRYQASNVTEVDYASEIDHLTKALDSALA